MPAWTASFVRNTLAAIALGVVFAWLGVYGTLEMDFPIRVAYWVGLMGLGFAASAFAMPLVFDVLLKASHPAIQIAVTSALISIPITAGLLGIEVVLDDQRPLRLWPQLYLYVFVISAIMTAGAWVLDRLNDHQAAASQAAAPTGSAANSPAPFADRLPVKLRSADIYAVSAEDHYLRVHTSAGQELILMRLADAIRELRGLEGLQTHRSWWVARQGLADVVKGDGKLSLKIKSGAEAPVSRTYLKDVRDAGWL